MEDRARPGPQRMERVREFLTARFDPESQVGLGLTISVVIFALAVWALSGLLDAILDNDTLVRTDALVESWFHANATPGGLRIFTAITQLGSVVVFVVAVVVAVYLWRRRQMLLLWNWLGALLGYMLVEYVLKLTVQRPRPQYSAAYLHGRSYSFPSGHTMAATVCYLLLAYFIASRPRTTPTVRITVFVVASVLILAVALSRLYLGVHYPSDVIGGMAAGLAWLSVCGATRRILAPRAS